MNLLHTSRYCLGERDASLAQALADVAAVVLLQQRGLDRGHREKVQREQALTSRVLIEQAKGVPPERWNTDPDAAFHLMRSYARGHQLRISDCARQIMDKSLDTDQIPRP